MKTYTVKQIKQAFKAGHKMGVWDARNSHNIPMPLTEEKFIKSIQ